MRKTLIILTLSISLLGFKGDNWQKVKISDEISISMPADFMPMSADQLTRKYTSSRAPLGAFADMNDEIDLGINKAYSQWQEGDMEIMRSFYRSTILSLYDEVNFIKEEIREVNGKQYIYFEYESTVKSDEENAIVVQTPVSRYVIIQYTIHKGNTFLINFSCPYMLKDKWAPVGHRIMESVKIK